MLRDIKFEAHIGKLSFDLVVVFFEIIKINVFIVMDELCSTDDDVLRRLIERDEFEAFVPFLIKEKIFLSDYFEIRVSIVDVKLILVNDEPILLGGLLLDGYLKILDVIAIFMSNSR